MAELLDREAALERWLDLAQLGEADREEHDPLKRALGELTSPGAGLGLAEDGVDPCVLALDGRRLAMPTPRRIGGDGARYAITYRSLGLAEDLALRIDSEVEAGPRGKITRRNWALAGHAGVLDIVTRTPHDLERAVAVRGEAVMRRAAELVGASLGS